MYNLEQENSYKKNITLKTQKAIGNIKRINMINIHSEKRFLEKFIKDLNNKNKESIKERDINQRNLLANYKKSLPLPNDKVFSHKPSLFSDDKLHIINSCGVSSNIDQHCKSSFVL